MKKILCLLCIVVAAVLSTSAQAPEKPIRWRVTSKMTSATEGVVTLRPICNEGWHIYGTEEVNGGPVPTSFSFEGSQGIEFVGGVMPSTAPTRKFQEMFGAELSYWDGTVTFMRKFRLKDAAKAVVVGKIRYMGCDDHQCIPPQTYTFSVKPKPFKNK